MKDILTINLLIKCLLWTFLYLREMNPITTEKIIEQKRKNEEIQIVDMKIGKYDRVKIINSDYIPNRVYVNNVLTNIDSSGYIILKNKENLFNNITMEWDKKAIKYSKLFQNIESALEIDLSRLDISGIKSIKNMFINCNQLKSINFGNFDTSSITDMSSMFENCFSIEELNLSIFNTSNVIYMNSMFKGCNSLTSLDLSNFQTSKLENISRMFEDCNYLEYLDITSFNTSLITSMDSLFSGCHALISINLTNFITNQVKNMTKMFNLCSSLIYIDLSNLDTSKVKDMSFMFGNCFNLISLNLSNFFVSKVENMESMFAGCLSLELIDLSNFDTSELTKMDYMFSNCNSLLSLDISSFSISQRSMVGFCEYCTSLTSIKFSREYKLVGNIFQMFSGCLSLHSLDLYNFDFGLNTNFESLFSGCISLTSLDLSNIDSSSVTNMVYMFLNCKSLKKLNIKHIKASQVKYMSGMFYNCSSLTSIDLSSFNSSLVIEMSSLFFGCSRLVSLDISNFNTSLITNMNSMFSGCSSLTYLNLSNFITSLVFNMDSMFFNCKNLKSLDLSSFNTEKLGTIDKMFYGCINLEYINIYNFSDGFINKPKHLFYGTKDNIVYCIKNESNAEIIINEIRKNKCPINDCSTDWKHKKKKMIDKNNICIDECQNDGTYKYEYEYNCFDKCPKGTLSSKDNLYICEKIINECNAHFPFISVKNKSCIEECTCQDFFDDICTVNNIDNKNQTNLTDNIIKGIQNGSINYLLEDVMNEKKDIIKIANDTLYQITSTYNQNNKIYDNISSIKFGQCENILKDIYNIPSNEPLIIFKTEKYIEGILIPLIYYDIFNPITKEKLDFNYCKNIYIDFIIPVSIDEKNSFEYDPNNSYYNDFCHTYTSENNTDIILYDRKNKFNNLHLSLCENNCSYNGYDSKNKKSLCHCPIKDRIIFIQKINKSELIFKFDIKKQPMNFYVIKCYKNLFSNEIIKNIGNYIILIILFINLLSAFLVYTKEYDLLLKQIGDLLNTTILENNNETHSKKDSKFDEQLKDISIGGFYSSKNTKFSSLKNNISKSNNEIKIDLNFSISNNDSDNSKTKNWQKKQKNYLDYEINTFSYQEALENDQRTNFQYYISLIRLKHIIIFTFFYSNKDYNSFMIKICLFFLYFSLYFLTNTIFFYDSTLHKIYEDGGKFNFIYNLPKIIYSSIISSIIYAFVRKLTLTSQNILEIKHEKKNHNLNARVLIAIKKIKIKFICFFLLNIFFLLIIWYYISCFCAVYKNSQLYLVKNTLISYFISLIYPFIISFIPCFFRISAFKGFGIYLYRISKVIQFM